MNPESGETGTRGLENENCKGKKVVFLYSTEEAKEVLNGLTLVANCDITDRKEVPQQIIEKQDILTAYPKLTQMYCSTCSVSFDNRNDLASHFKGDFHRFNVRMKMRGTEPVREEQFEDMTGNISSISGSDSEDSESTDTDQDGCSLPVSGIQNEIDEFMKSYSRRQRIFFRNGNDQLVSVHRCLVFGKKCPLKSSFEVLQAVKRLPAAQKWAIFMASGGHFAGALFDGEQVLQHKTFHRYVVRAKRGTAQSQRDKQGNAPRSAGATLRRYNEAALTQEIQELIISWSSELRECSRIFLRAPGFNNAIFFGGKTPAFDKSDSRIYAISIHTRRPTFHELKRVHKELSSVEVYDQDFSISQYILSKKSNSESNKTSTEERKLPRKKADVPKETPNSSLSIELDTEKQKEVSSDSSSESGELSWITSTFDTSALKQFECTKRPRQRKKKTENKTKKKEENVLLSRELQELQDRLFTSCKIGNLASFELTLESLRTYLKNQIAADRTTEMMMQEFSDSLDVSADQTNGQAKCDVVQDSSVQTIDLVLQKQLSVFLSHRFGAQLTTLLHVATRGGNKQIMNKLMANGADPAVRDAQNQVPILAATMKDTKNEFRRFMAQYPNKYDYLKAQVPGPLTEDMENERKAKAAEKKKIQKKAKKEKLKETQIEEEKQKAEESAKKAFLAMSDREKRAFAAEQRFKMQREKEQDHSTRNGVLIRCWECGYDLTGKVPYEYYDYKFCSPTCLKEHRLKTLTKS